MYLGLIPTMYLGLTPREGLTPRYVLRGRPQMLYFSSCAVGWPTGAQFEGAVIGSDRAALGEPDSSALFCVYSGPETLSAGPETLSARLLRAG